MPRVTSLVLIAAAALACTDGQDEPTGPMMVPVFQHGAAGAGAANGGNFGTPLSSAEEPTPENVSESNARGSAVFHLSEDGETVTYQLMVANISNVNQAHIHIGPPGGTGPVAVWLYPSVTPGAGPSGQGRIQGVISRGSFTAANFVGPLAGLPMSALIDAINANNAYVNVHTNDGIAPTNTGPGDFPSGEIRGAIEYRGH